MPGRFQTDDCLLHSIPGHELKYPMIGCFEAFPGICKLQSLFGYLDSPICKSTHVMFIAGNISTDYQCIIGNELYLLILLENPPHFKGSPSVPDHLLIKVFHGFLKDFKLVPVQSRLSRASQSAFLGAAGLPCLLHFLLSRTLQATSLRPFEVDDFRSRWSVFRELKIFVDYLLIIGCICSSVHSMYLLIFSDR